MTTRRKTLDTVVLENVNTGKHVIIKRMVWRDSLGQKKEGWFRHGKPIQPMFNYGIKKCTITTTGGRFRMTEYEIVDRS